MARFIDPTDPDHEKSMALRSQRSSARLATS